MVKSIRVRHVATWFDIASGRNRPPGTGGRGDMPASLSHENDDFCKNEPIPAKSFPAEFLPKMDASIIETATYVVFMLFCFVIPVFLCGHTPSFQSGTVTEFSLSSLCSPSRQGAKSLVMFQSPPVQNSFTFRCVCPAARKSGLTCAGANG